MDAVEDKVALADLYRRWERDFWSADGIDLSRDKVEWLALSERERRQWYWLAGFSHFRETEPHAVSMLAMLLPLLRLPEQQGVLALQLADEGRHAYFFERFHREVLAAAVPEADLSKVGISDAYRFISLDGVTASARAAAAEPSRENLAAAVFHVFVVLEGALALASFSMIRLLLSRLKIFPGLLFGLTKAHQDEVRHTQLGIVILQDLLALDPQIRNTLLIKHKELMPSFSEVLRPRAEREALLTSLGFRPAERRQRAFAHLRRSYGILGLDTELLTPWETLKADSADPSANQRARA